jgi:hypothetical protein
MQGMIPEEVVQWTLARKAYAAEAFKEPLKRIHEQDSGVPGILSELLSSLDTLSFYFLEYAGRFAAEKEKEKIRASFFELADLSEHLDECLESIVKLLPVHLDILYKGEPEAEKLKMSDIQDKIPFSTMSDALMIPIKEQMESFLADYTGEDKGMLAFHIADSLSSFALVRFCLGFIPIAPEDVPLSELSLFEALYYECDTVLLCARFKAEPFDGKGLTLLTDAVSSWLREQK